MSEHIHEVYGISYKGVFSCVNCPKQFSLDEVNQFNIMVVQR